MERTTNLELCLLSYLKICLLSLFKTTFSIVVLFALLLSFFHKILLAVSFQKVPSVRGRTCVVFYGSSLADCANK